MDRICDFTYDNWLISIIDELIILIEDYFNQISIN